LTYEAGSIGLGAITEDAVVQHLRVATRRQNSSPAGVLGQLRRPAGTFASKSTASV